MLYTVNSSADEKAILSQYDVVKSAFKHFLLIALT